MVQGLVEGKNAVNTPNTEGTRKLAKASVFMMVMTLLSRVLGLAKNMAIAYLFGTTATVDAFWLALTVPMIFAFIFTTGADNYIPIFSKYLAEKGKEKAWEAGNVILTLYLGLIILGVVVGALSTPILVKILAPGFQVSVQHLTVRLIWVMMGMSLFLGLSSLGRIVLYNEEKFYAPVLGGVFNNVVILLVMTLFYKKWGIFAAAVGISIGASCQVLVQLPQLWSLRRHLALRFNLKHRAVRDWARLTFPLYLGRAGSELNSAVDKIFASFLPIGAISALSYGFLIIELPTTVFSHSLLNALFPRLSREASRQDSDGDREIMKKSLRIITLFLLPIMVAIILFRKAIVKIIFEHGAFSEKSAEMTAVAILFYGLGILAFGLNDALVFGFNAHHNNVDSMKIGWVRVLANIVLNAVLVTTMGLAGLALATTLSGYLKLGILWVVYQKKYGCVVDSDWRPWLQKVAISTFLLAATLIGYRLIFGPLLGVSSFWGELGYLTGGLTAGLLVFLVGAFVLGIEEVISIKAFATTQLRIKFGFQE